MTAGEGWLLHILQDRSSQDSLSEALGSPRLHVEQSLKAARELLEPSPTEVFCEKAKSWCVLF
jgi:hypothetical protein